MERWVAAPPDARNGELLDDLHFTLVVQAYLVMLSRRDGLPLRKAADGAELLELFASKESFAAEYSWPDESENIALLGFDKVIAFLRARPDLAGIIVDPGSIGWVVDRPTLMRLAAAKGEAAPIYRMLRLPRHLKPGQWRECPSKITDALTSYAQTDRRIRRMWLWPVDIENRPSCLLVVRTRGDADEVFCGLARAARGITYRPLAILTVDRYGDQVASGVAPIFARRWL